MTTESNKKKLENFKTVQTLTLMKSKKMKN